MRPRIAFATVFALGAGMHLLVLISPPRSVGYLAVYLCWLLPSIAFALFIWAKSYPPRPLSALERRMRRDSPELWMEGLGLFVGVAARVLANEAGKALDERGEDINTTQHGFRQGALRALSGNSRRRRLN